MKHRIKNIILGNFSKDAFVVSAGTLINAFAGGLFFIIVPRVLGPSDYGLFSTVVAASLLAVSIANFGIDTGILRFASKDKSIFSFAFKSYIVLGLIVSLIGFMASGLISNFLNQDISLLLRLAFLSTIFLLLTNFFVAGLQVRGKFFKAAVVNIFANVARLVLIVLLFYFYKIDLLVLTAIFFLAPLISVVVGRIFFPFEIHAKPSVNTKLFHKYNFWIAAGLIVSSIPFDSFLLLKLGGPVQAGLYAAPFKFLAISYQFGGNFTRVIAARITAVDTGKEVIDFAKNIILFPLIFIFGLILIIFLSPLSIHVLGIDYLGVVSIINVLVLGFIFFFLSTIPSSIILYYLGKPEISFIITAIRYVFFVVLLLILVPANLALGAAVAFTVSEFTSFLLMTCYVISSFVKRR